MINLVSYLTLLTFFSEYSEYAAQCLQKGENILYYEKEKEKGLIN